MKQVYRNLYGATLGIMLGMIVGGMIMAIALDIRQWDTWGLSSGFFIMQLLWAFIGGVAGWLLIGEEE